MTDKSVATTAAALGPILDKVLAAQQFVNNLSTDNGK